MSIKDKIIIIQKSKQNSISKQSLIEKKSNKAKNTKIIIITKINGIIKKF
jgi:hypothetical protein